MATLEPQTLESEPLLEHQHVATEVLEIDSILTGRQPYCEPGLRGILTSRYVVICAAFVTLAGLLFGYDQGVISIILVEDQFLERFPEAADDAPGSGLLKGLLTAMIELGAFLGALNQGWIADLISRKYSIMLASSIFILGSVLQTSAITYNILVLARFVGGVGIGMLSMVAPLWISEIAPPEIRGSLLVFEELSIVTGIVMAFWFTYATRYIDSEWAWRLPFAIQILPGLLLGFGAILLPFSPRWLVTQNREREALVTLSTLRQLPMTDKRVLLEWCDMRAEVALHQEIHSLKHGPTEKTSFLQREMNSWSDLFRKSCRSRTHIGVGVMFFQQFVGINAIIYYAPSMLRILGLNYDLQLIMSGVVNMAQLFGVLTTVWSMDSIGRRPLLLLGSIGMFLCHSIIGILVGSFSQDWQAHSTQGWLCVVLLNVYMVIFGMSWASVPWVLPSEVFPSSLRAKGVAISSCSNWINNFIIGLITPPLIQQSGYGAYLFFAIFSLFSFIWTYYIVPETAGKTLEDINSTFENAQGEEEHRHRILKKMCSEVFAD